jgi:putative membrane protein
MKVKLFATVATLALALGACGQKGAAAPEGAASDTAASDAAAAGDMAPGATATPAAMMSGQDFANTAGASDAFEIASSKLAAANAQSAKVKAFAAQMIKAHTESTAKLKTAGASASPAITPDPTLKPEQQQDLDMLKGKTGAEFDTAYAAAQVKGHQQALALLNQYSAQGDVPQLKSFAGATAPIVTEHLSMAQGLP